jgi:hypothetical protein
MGYKKENYKYFQDRGRCPYCKGQRFAEPGLKVCAVCREKRNARLKEMRDEWRSAGLCTRCGKPVEGERRTCESCLAKHNQLYGEQKRAADREKYHQRLDAGKCVRCGIAWAEPGHSFCRKCLDKHLLECKRYDPDHAKANARREARRKAGLCIDCGKPAMEGKSRCQRCYERQQDSGRKRSILNRIDREIEEIRRANHANR